MRKTKAEFGLFFACKGPKKESSDKRGRISVTVGDRENFIENEIVERKILHRTVVLLFALGPFFNGF